MDWIALSVILRRIPLVQCTCTTHGRLIERILAFDSLPCLASDNRRIKNGFKAKHKNKRILKQLIRFNDRRQMHSWITPFVFLLWIYECRSCRMIFFCFIRFEHSSTFDYPKCANRNPTHFFTTTQNPDLSLQSLTPPRVSLIFYPILITILPS